MEQLWKRFDAFMGIGSIRKDSFDAIFADYLDCADSVKSLAIKTMNDLKQYRSHYCNPVLCTADAELKRKAERGDPVAAFVYALYCEDVVSKQASVKYYRIACEAADYSGAMFVTFEFAITLDQDLLNPTEALPWYRKSAELGNPRAQHQLGYFYDEGKFGFPKDILMAIECYEKAIKLGWTRSMFHLACTYDPFYNYGFEGMEEKAIELYKRAAARGHCPSKVNLQRLTSQWIKDEKEAKLEVEGLKAEALGGNIHAMRNLGLHLLLKNGGYAATYDLQKAKQFLLLAVQLGDETAVRALKALQEQEDEQASHEYAIFMVRKLDKSLNLDRLKDLSSAECLSEEQKNEKKKLKLLLERRLKATKEVSSHLLRQMDERTFSERINLDNEIEKKFCAVCGCRRKPKAGGTGYCGKCLKLWYCSKECQKDDWSYHKYFCLST